MDLSNFSASELRALDAKVTAQIPKAEARSREAAIEQIYAVAHKLGMSLQSVMDGGGVKPAASRRQGQRYRDPSEPSNTWAGIGPRPLWFKKALAAGVPLDTLRE